MNKLSNKKEILLLLTVYLIYVSMDNNKSSKLKIAKKRISRNIAKLIAIYRKTTSVNDYIKLVNDGSGISNKSQQGLVLESISEPMVNINPYIFLVLLRERFPDLFTEELVSKSDLEIIKGVFTDTIYLISTLMFVNRLVDNIDIYIGNTPMTYNYVNKTYRKKVTYENN